MHTVPATPRSPFLPTWCTVREDITTADYFSAANADDAMTQAIHWHDPFNAHANIPTSQVIGWLVEQGH